jgi:hypothetical protein
LLVQPADRRHSRVQGHIRVHDDQTCDFCDVLRQDACDCSKPATPPDDLCVSVMVVTPGAPKRPDPDPACDIKQQHDDRSKQREATAKAQKQFSD